MKSTIKWIKRYFSFLCQMFMHFSISRYIWKLKHSIYCCYTPVEPHQRPCYYHFSFQFSYNFFNIYLFLKYLYFLQSFSIPYHLLTTLYLNITLHLPFFCSFLFTHSYYKCIIISSILYILFPHKKGSLSLNFLVKFLFFLHLCFRLIIILFFRTLY